MSLGQSSESRLAAALAALTSVNEIHDQETVDHCHRVGLLAEGLAACVGCDPLRVRATAIAGGIHDLGKVFVPRPILQKPGKLTPEEITVVRHHSAEGADLLGRLMELESIAPIVRAHHERHDGDGYPDGLRGTAIPRESVLIAVCDSWDAMTSPRPYRRAMQPGEAAAILRAGRESQWDPDAVDAFLRLVGH